MKNITRKLVATIILIVLVIPFTQVVGQGGEELPDLNGMEILVAVENAYPPFNYIDVESGEPVGWDYDAWIEICNRLNCVPVMDEWAWDGIFAGLAGGQYDAICSSVSITEERKKSMDFSEPYFKVRQALVVKKDSTAKSLEDMVGKKVGSQISTTGTFAVQYLRHRSTEAGALRVTPASVTGWVRRAGVADARVTYGIFTPNGPSWMIPAWERLDRLCRRTRWLHGLSVMFCVYGRKN